MRKMTSIFLVCMTVFTLVAGLGTEMAHAEKDTQVLPGVTYDLGEKDQYELAKGKKTADHTARFYVKGAISTIDQSNGFTRYAVESGNLDIMIDKQFAADFFDQFEQSEKTRWHIAADKTKSVDGIKLSQNIDSGAIIIQTSKDGKAWITSDYETDFYNKMDTMNNRSANGEATNAFSRTTNVQLANGCYYRIIVAYKLKREVDPSKVLFVNVKQTETKERIEVYQFYAYDPSVDQQESLNRNGENVYQFDDVSRVDSPDGFSNPKPRTSDDPHNDWSVGTFYISGYTDYLMDNGVPVFLKVPGDRAALWFNLEQELDKCNGRTDVKINYIESGSDIYFGTPTIKDFGRGALIIRKTDKGNKKERQIYKNYLEASATVGANTRVDLFEEGDYEVALDYQLHYDKPFVFGTTTTKTLTYRIFFKFKVRNGDISAFIRDIDTDQFITNANVAEHGFYIDVSNSQYLTMNIKREVLTESLDGLVQDTKLSEVATEGRLYTDEGIYTVTIKNLATGDTVTKQVYVGNRDILLAHMNTGLSISEINERIAAGAFIDEKGQIVEPELEATGIFEDDVATDGIAKPGSAEALPIVSPGQGEAQESANNISSKDPKRPENTYLQNVNVFIVTVTVLSVLVVSGAVLFLKNRKKNNVATKEETRE